MGSEEKALSGRDISQFLSAGSPSHLRVTARPEDVQLDFQQGSRRSRSRAFSNVTLPFVSTTESYESEKPPGITLPRPNQKKTGKAEQETRKLLSHILAQLDRRRQAPNVWDAFRRDRSSENSDGRLAFFRSGKFRSTTNLKSTTGKRVNSRSPSFADGESEDEKESYGTTFSTDDTFELMCQLKEVLWMSKLHGWSIFTDIAGSHHDSDPGDGYGKSSSFRRKRSSFQSLGKRSRSMSPNGRTTIKSSPELLQQCLCTLGSIVLEDCRFQSSSIRLTRPPNALHALILDIALLIVNIQHHSPKIMYDIAFIFIPAFSSFPPTTHSRLLTFFENGILRPMLDALLSMQKGVSVSTGQDAREVSYTESEPVVAIQVDEALDEPSMESSAKQGWRRWTPKVQSSTPSILSNNAPAQSIYIYHLGSAVAPLLATIFDHVDFETDDRAISQQLHSIIQLITSRKSDAALNLLEIVAYNSPHARYSAVNVLMSYWPKVVGHLGITKPFSSLSYVYARQQVELRRSRIPIPHPHQHQFVPWRFNPNAASAVFEGSAFHDCQSCSKQIRGFGVFCPFCFCAVHSECYDAPGGSCLSHYPVLNDESTQRVAVHRFSYVQPRCLGAGHEAINVDQHIFRLVNIFTLSLCGVCQGPLWGWIAQGYRCGFCNQYAHKSCLADGPVQRLARCSDESHSGRITIDWATMRTSFADYYRDLLLREEDIIRHSQEEISIYWAILWLQLELLKFGVASGSIIVSQIRPKTLGAKGGGVDDFELHYLEKLYEAYLRSGKLERSPVLQDCVQQSGGSIDFHHLFFEWPILMFITSVIKTSLVNNGTGKGALLSVVPSGQEDQDDDLHMHPFEVVSVAHVRDALGQEFNLFHDQAACLFLAHLHHIGLLESDHLPEGTFRQLDRPFELTCSFPLPLGLDFSGNVETLIVAVETCLKDLSLNINEAGLLMLTRLLWPNGMASDYALARLSGAVVNWVLAEDDNLAVILRDYVSGGQTLPAGVPSNNDTMTWPNAAPSRSTSSGSIRNGGDYVVFRKAVLTKYASRWLFALHCQDPVTYAKLLFDIVLERSEEVYHRHNTAALEDIAEQGVSDDVLRCLLKLHQSSVTFSALDDLLVFWLDSLDIASPYQVIPTLTRLFNRDPDGSARWTTHRADVTFNSFEQPGQISIDPWRVVTNISTEGVEGLLKAIHWLRIFSSSGVDIPSTIFMQAEGLLDKIDGSFEDYAALNEAIFISIWFKSFGRQNLQPLLTKFLNIQMSYVTKEAQTDLSSDINIIKYIRLLLASCLLLYGCDRSRLREIKIIQPCDVDQLSARRKVTKRASMVTEPVQLQRSFFETLLVLLERGSEQMRQLVATFLSVFTTESSLLSPQEVDNIVLSGGDILIRCAWKFYDIDLPTIDDLRISFLLRLLVTDVLPLEDLLEEYFDPQVSRMIRYKAATQLFRIVLDVTKPSFHVEGRQWMSSVIPVFVRLFSCIWADPSEEIRSATDTWAQTLQPAHLRAIGNCFNEALSRAPISDRLKLVSFLLKLRTHFPSWKVLSWDVIIETLMDDDFIQRNGGGEEGAAAAHLSMYGISSQDQSFQVQDPDMATLQSSLILLSLQMIADGIQIDVFSYLKIKFHLLVVLGSVGASLVPAPSGHSFHVQHGEVRSINSIGLACIPGMMLLLDSFRPFDLSPSAMTGADDDAVTQVLVGSGMVDVVLVLFNYMENIQEMPVIYAKAMLQSLIIVIYKHDLEAAPLRNLRDHLRRVVRKVSDILTIDVSYELRLLALTVIKVYLKRYPSYATGILLHQAHITIKLISSLNISGDDILVAQASAFLEDVLAQYAASGLFYQLCKRDLDRDAFDVIRHVVSRSARSNTDQPLRDAILLDTMIQLQSQPHDPLQKRVSENLRDYIEIVHHQGFSTEVLAVIGRGMANIMKNAGDLSSEQFDPNPHIVAVTTLLQHNKAQSRELLAFMDSILRPALLRFDVGTQTLVKLLQVTVSLYRRTADGGAQSNVVLTVTTELLTEALRGRNRVTPLTLVALVESTSASSAANRDPLYISNDVLSRLASDGYAYLQMFSGPEANPQTELRASMAVAGLILRGVRNDLGLLSRQLNDNSFERNGKPSSMRAWNVIVLECLQTFPDEMAAHILTHLSTFSLTYHTTLRMNLQLIGVPSDLTSSEVNHAFIAMKLWLLLARKCSGRNPQVADDGVESSSEDRNASLVWNELWPPFERLVSLFESDWDAEVVEGSPLANLIWSSIADIFLFLRQMRSSISLESSSHIATLNRVKALGRGEAFTGKFMRTVQSMSETPPELPTEVLLTLVAHELLAAEKLHYLETKRDFGRSIPERSRRDLRTATSS